MYSHLKKKENVFHSDRIIHEHFTRCSYLRFPRNRMVLYEKEPYYAGMKAYDRLPEEMKPAVTIYIFRRIKRLPCFTMPLRYSQFYFMNSVQ